jgi:carbon-monoxide dehydrogenase medium subunit
VKPVRFDYARPADTASAIALAARDDVVAKYIAGGQSLGPMLNLRLAQPDLLIDLSGIEALTAVEQTADALVIGACITHADIEDGRVGDLNGGVLRGVARGIAYRAVRNRGTIGGSIAHADPAADWIACLAALGASLQLRGPSGARALPVADVMVRAFETTLMPGELIEAVVVPLISRRARFGFYKLARKTGEFAHAMAAVLLDPERAVCRAAIGATESRPIVWADARALFRGGPEAGLAMSCDAAPAREALASAGLNDPIGQQLQIVALRRAVEQASA